MIVFFGFGFGFNFRGGFVKKTCRVSAVFFSGALVDVKYAHCVNTLKPLSLTHAVLSSWVSQSRVRARARFSESSAPDVPTTTHIMGEEATGVASESRVS